MVFLFSHGSCRFFDGGFGIIGNHGFWWSATETSDNFVWKRYLIYSDIEFGRNQSLKEGEFSIRCIKN